MGGDGALPPSPISHKPPSNSGRSEHPDLSNQFKRHAFHSALIRRDLQSREKKMS